jgi:putative transposase
VELIFDPLELADVEVRLDGRHAGMAVPLRIKRHVHRRPQLKPPGPVKPTGVDYLALIPERRERELQRRVDYRHLPASDGMGSDNADRKENIG